MMSETTLVVLRGPRPKSGEALQMVISIVPKEDVDQSKYTFFRKRFDEKTFVMMEEWVPIDELEGYLRVEMNRKLNETRSD